MNYWEFEDMSQGYRQLVEAVELYGRRRAPRGMKTSELPGATFVLKDPTKAFPLNIGRKFGRAIAAAEALSLVGGVTDPALMLSVGANFGRFLDGGYLHGAYGPRIRGHLPTVVEKIREDKDTRQAVLQIWDARYDQAGWTPRDLPCTLTIVLSAYDGKLEADVTMRSNDVWWGTAHDVPMFTMLQLTVASALGLDPGPYTHHAVSLHMYDRDLEEADKLHEPEFPGADEHVPWVGVESPAGIEQGMERARAIIQGAPYAMPSPTEKWCIDTLAPHVERAKQSRREAMTGLVDGSESS